MSDGLVQDPTWQRFITVMRSALATYDAEGQSAPDRHHGECPCPLCELVRDTRRMVAYFDEATRLAERERQLLAAEELR